MSRSVNPQQVGSRFIRLSPLLLLAAALVALAVFFVHAAPPAQASSHPHVSFYSSAKSVQEGDSVTVTIQLSEALASNVTIPIAIDTTWATTAGDRAQLAESGDYGTLASIAITAGATSGTGTITTSQDSDNQDDTFRLIFGTLPSTVRAGDPSEMYVIIRDDDKPAPTVGAIYSAYSTVWQPGLGANIADLGSGDTGCKHGVANKSCDLLMRRINYSGNNVPDFTFGTRGGTRGADKYGYEIRALVLNSGTLTLTLNKNVPTDINLAFETGASFLRVSEGTVSGNTVTWTSSGISWSAGDNVHMRLVERTVPECVAGNSNRDLSMNPLNMRVSPGKGVLTASWIIPDTGKNYVSYLIRWKKRNTNVWLNDSGEIGDVMGFNQIYGPHTVQHITGLEHNTAYDVEIRLMAGDIHDFRSFVAECIHSGWVSANGTTLAASASSSPTTMTVSGSGILREGGGTVNVYYTLNQPAPRDIYATGGGPRDTQFSLPFFVRGSTLAVMGVQVPQDTDDNNCRTVSFQNVFDYSAVSFRDVSHFTVIDDDGAADTGCTGRFGSATATRLTLEQVAVSDELTGTILVTLRPTLNKAAVRTTNVEVFTASGTTATRKSGANRNDFEIFGATLAIHHPHQSPKYRDHSGIQDWPVVVYIWDDALDSEVIVLQASTDKPALRSNTVTLNIGQLRRQAQQAAPGQQGSPPEQESGSLPSSVTLALGQTSVSESAGTVRVTATLDAPAPADGTGVTLGLYPGNDSTATRNADYTMPNVIEIAAGRRSGSATITITDDDLHESDETVQVGVFADLGYATLAHGATLTITDDDTAANTSGVTVTAASPLAVDEGATATYTVVLDSKPTADVTITASSGDTGAASVSPTSRVFTPSTWSTAQTFTVSGVADTDTNDETVGISHGVTSADTNYAAALVSTVSVSVSDTTTAPPQQQNRAPTVASAIADATIVNQSGTQTVSLSGVFSDADSDTLIITASSSNTAVATVSVAADYSGLTVSAQSRGAATITVTADDGNGGTVSDTFTVRVKAAPTVASAIGDVSGLTERDTRDVSLSGVFRDADGDSLTITASSSDNGNATVSVASGGSRLTLSGVAEGTATVTVTAQDSDGNRVSDQFTVTVEAPAPPPEEPAPADGAPTVAQPLADISLRGPTPREISLAGVFDDPDGDSLTITAVSSHHHIATMWLSVDHSTLTVVGISTGTATITVTARDADGNEVSDEFEVTVSPAS